MKLHIEVTLDSGGTITISGEDLTAEGVNEVFAILGGYNIEATTTPEPIDLPLPPVTDAMQQGFREGFEEARTQGET